MMARGLLDTTSVKRVALVAPDGLSLSRQRSDLIAEILARRHSVLALLPEHAAQSIPALAERGITAATFPWKSEQPSILADRQTVASITAQLLDWRAHVALCYGAKTLPLGAQAAKNARVTRRAGLVTALPPAMMAKRDAKPSWAWQRLLKSGYKALDTVIFHNDGHQAQLANLGCLPRDITIVTVPGSGVDLVRHHMQPMPPLVNDGRTALNFAMVARLDAAKGVVEFCEAASHVKKRFPDARFILAGRDGDLDRNALSRYVASVEIIDDQGDAYPLLTAAHVIVLPSWGEALPRILLEALATGRPIITTSIPGARETVDERVNGVLVPPKDVAALVEAMESFIARPELIPAMGRASRSKAERRFDVRAVNATLLQVLGL
jgi:glycosyltransferase involved in cell wall biosynthesis